MRPSMVLQDATNNGLDILRHAWPRLCGLFLSTYRESYVLVSVDQHFKAWEDVN